jgi:hypothetical protein
MVLRLTLILLVLISLLLMLSVLTATGVSPSVTVAVDLYHVRNSTGVIGGLDILIESCPGCKWVLIGDPWWHEFLTEMYKSMGYNVELRGLWQKGSIREGVLDDVDILIIGAVHGEEEVISSFMEEELEIIAKWWASGGRKAVWVASVGDYIIEYRIAAGGPFGCSISQGKAEGRTSQFEVNRLLEILGSRIRVDWASVSSPLGPAEGLIVGGALGLAGGKVILPMAAPLYIVHEGSTYNPLYYSVEGVSVVVYADSEIINYDGKRYPPVFYEEGAKDSYPVMAVEKLDSRLIVVSGDTMIGGFIGVDRWPFCGDKIMQAGLYNSTWLWQDPYKGGETRAYEGPELVKATVAYTVKFIGGEGAEELLTRKPSTVTVVETPRATQGDTATTDGLIVRVALAFIASFVIVLVLLRLLRR